MRMRSVSSAVVILALVMLAGSSATAQTAAQAGTPAAKPLTEQQRRELGERAEKRRDIRQDRRDTRHDRRDIPQDNSDLRHDARDIARDKREVREARREGATKEVREARR